MFYAALFEGINIRAYLLWPIYLFGIDHSYWWRDSGIEYYQPVYTYRYRFYVRV